MITIPPFPCGVQRLLSSDRHPQPVRLLRPLAASRDGARDRVGEIHQEELFADWERARAQQELRKIAPLE